jgi:hypothetical protein
MNKSPRTDQIPVEVIQPGGKIPHFEIQKLNPSILNKRKSLQQWKESITVHI